MTGESRLIVSKKSKKLYALVISVAHRIWLHHANILLMDILLAEGRLESF